MADEQIISDHQLIDGYGFNNSSVWNSSFHIRLDARSSTIMETIYTLDTYVTPGVCVIGCLGNFLNMVVLTRSRFRQRDGRSESGAHLGLLLLAMSDMMYCIVLFPRALLPTTHLLFSIKGFRFIYQMYGEGLITTLSLISTWIIVDMALMRYIFICHPLKARQLDSLTIVKILYPVTIVTCALVNIPAFMRYTSDTFEYDDKNVTIIDINVSFDGTSSIGVSFMWLRASFHIFIPATCLIFCNFSLIQALRQSQRMRRECHVRDSQKSQKWITITLIVIALGFIIFVFPSELLDFFLEIIVSNVHKTESFLLIRSVANTMQVTNFAFNFVLYCIINVHFRSVLLDLCQEKCCLGNKMNRRFLSSYSRTSGYRRSTVTTSEQDTASLKELEDTTSRSLRGSSRGHIYYTAVTSLTQNHGTSV